MESLAHVSSAADIIMFVRDCGISELEFPSFNLSIRNHVSPRNQLGKSEFGPDIGSFGINPPVDDELSPGNACLAIEALEENQLASEFHVAR